MGLPPKVRTIPRFGAETSVFRKMLPSDAPLDPTSAGVIARFCDRLGVTDPPGQVVPDLSYREWTTTIFVAEPGVSTPRYRVEIDRPLTQAAADAAGGHTGFIPANAVIRQAFNDVPIPNDARPSGPWPDLPGNVTSHADHHMAIYDADPDSPTYDTFWEMWNTRHYEVDGPAPTTMPNGNKTQAAGAVNLTLPGWHCQYGGAIEGVSESPGYFDNTAFHGSGQGWGATASKIPKAFGLITTEEGVAAGAGQPNAIPHAINWAWPYCRQWPHVRWPAQATDGGGQDPYDPEQGSILRFPANVNLSGVTDPFVHALCEAIRDYGMVLMDTSGSMNIYAEAHNQTAANAPTAAQHVDTELDIWQGSTPWPTQNTLPPGGSVGVLKKQTAGNSSNSFGIWPPVPWTKLQLVDASYRPAAPTKSRFIISL